MDIQHAMESCFTIFHTRRVQSLLRKCKHPVPVIVALTSLCFKTDPDAKFVMRAGKGTFPAYKAHLCVDRKKRVVASVEDSKATEGDMSKVSHLYTSNSILGVGKRQKL